MSVWAEIEEVLEQNATSS